MDPVDAALFAIVVPAAAATAALLGVRALTAGRATATGVGAAVAAGFVAAFLGIAGLSAFPPRESWHWMAFVAVVSAALGVAEARVPELARSAIRVAAVALTVGVSVPPPERATLGAVAIAIAALASARGLDALSGFGGPAAALASFAVSTLAAAICLLLFSGWAVLGLLCGAMTTAAVACLVLGFKVETHARDASLPASMLLAGAAANGAHFAELPVHSAILLAAAPCCGALAVGLLARRGGSLRLVLRAVGGAAIPAGIAVALAAHAAPRF